MNKKLIAYLAGMSSSGGYHSGTWGSSGDGGLAVNAQLANPAGAESVDTGTDTAETLDLLENLEFYEWLSEQDTQEQQS